MGVQITENHQKYSWQDCSLTWDECVKPWDMAGNIDYGVDITEVILTIETLFKTVKLKKKETAALAEHQAKTLNKAISEAAAFTETYWDYIQFKLSFGENIAVAETPQKLLTRGFSESFGVGERRVLRNTRKVPAETLDVADELSRTAKFTVDFKEAASLTDGSSRKLKKWFFEDIDPEEVTPQKLIALAKAESAAIADEHKQTVLFCRDFAENATVSDEVTKLMELLKQDNAALYDALLEACGGVISNIAIAEGDINLSKFEEVLKTAPGYTTFMDFKVGEYEYQDALVRLVLEASVEQTQPSVSKVIMHVDIPDTQDRGTVEINKTDGATQVLFNKKFYNPPEVIVTLRGGNTGDGVIVPHVVSTDKRDENSNRFFEVELLNNMGQRVTGVVAWQALGY